MCVGLLLWSVVSLLGVADEALVPSPGSVWQELEILARNGLIFRDCLATLEPAVIGFVIAAIGSSVAGVALASRGFWSAVATPYVAGVQAIPVLALSPVIVSWFGVGLSARSVVCALVVFFPLTVSIAVGLRTVDVDILDAGALDGAPGWRALWNIRVPLAMPSIFGGIRISGTLSLTGAFVSELIASSSGLGYRTLVARSEFNAPMLLSVAVVLVSIAIMLYLLVLAVEWFVLRWIFE